MGEKSMDKPADIFICHSSRDKAFAGRLRADLQVYGVSVWLDEEQLGLADKLTPEIEKAISEVRYLGLILSSHSVKSDWVKKECDFASRQNIAVLPILIEKIDIPKEFADILYANFTELEDDHAYHRAFHQVLARLGRQPALQSTLIIYRNGLTVGWENSSWKGRWQEKSRDYRDTGNYAFRAELQAFGGVAFGFRSGIDTASYSQLQFAINGGKQGGQALKVYFNGGRGNGVKTPVELNELLPDKWQLVGIPLIDLDVENTIIFKVNWSEISGRTQPPFYLADVSLISRFAEETSHGGLPQVKEH
jgi:hypothetical protein